MRGQDLAILIISLFELGVGAYCLYRLYPRRIKYSKDFVMNELVDGSILGKKIFVIHKGGTPIMIQLVEAIDGKNVKGPILYFKGGGDYEHLQSEVLDCMDAYEKYLQKVWSFRRSRNYGSIRI